MSLPTLIAIETMKLEGERWKLLVKKDRARTINEFQKADKDLKQINIRIEQYQNVYRELKKVKK